MSKNAKTGIIIFLILIPLAFLIMPHYVQKALIHQYPDVDDYKIFPNDTLRAAKHRPWPESKSLNCQTIPKNALDSMMAYDPLAFLVIRQDSLVFERYFNNHSKDAISNSFSVTKSIVSILTGCAINDNLLKSIETPVHQLLPLFKKREDGKDVTLKHLLQMSSGIDYDESYASLFSPTTKSYYGSDLKKQMYSLGFIEEPGKQFDYIGANTQWMAMVLEKVTGKRLSEYAEEKLWGPLGAGQPALWSKDRKDGMVKAYCCFHATARDFARIGQLICDSGRIHNQQIIHPDYFREMTKPANHLLYQNKSVDFYGLHWWLTRWNHLDIVYARGIKGQYIITIPSEKIIMVRLGNDRSDIYQGNHPSDLFLYLRIGWMMAGGTLP